MIRRQANIAAQARAGAQDANLDLMKPTWQVIQPGVVRSTNKGIEIMGNTHIPMGDWDWPDIGHKTAGSITIQKFSDVKDLLGRYLQNDPENRFRLYLTPGGVRAFELGNRRTPTEFFSRPGVSELKIDPLYEKLAVTPSNMPDFVQEKGRAQQGLFNARVTPKVGRENDFVAFPVGEMGGFDADPRSVSQLKTYHDDLVERFYEDKKAAIQAALQKHLQGVDLEGLTLSPLVRDFGVNL